MENIKLLSIYLNDHLAGSVAALEVARRCRSSNEGTPLAEYLSTFVDELQDDQDVVVGILDSIEAKQDRIKQMAAWVAEKAGRLKLNGQIVGYSDLSRLLELEGLALGVEGKLSLWRSLKQVQGHHSQLAVVDLDRMIARAEEQRARIEEFRLGAAAIAFGGVGQPSS